jgi:hypothetical protein
MGTGQRAYSFKVKEDLFNLELKGKAIAVTGREAHRAVRRRGSHIF